MAGHLPSAQAKKGDKSLHLARNLRDEWKNVIPNDDMTTLQNRITLATEMKVGLESKRGFSRLFQAHAYRKYAQDTHHFARTVSDRVRDVEFSASSHQTSGDPDQLARTTVAAEATYRYFLGCKELFPTPEQESDWAKSVWPMACTKTGARVSPPGDLAERLAAVGPRFRVDLKAKITPLVQRLYGFETDEAPGGQHRNMDRARDLKQDTAFINGEGKNGLPYHHPIIQQAINVVWFDDGRRSDGVMFSSELFPLPYEAIALVLTVIECCLDEWSGGIWIDLPFTQEHYKETYVEHIASVKALTSQGLDTRHCDPLYRLRRDLHHEGRKHAGVPLLVASDGHHVWRQDKVNAVCEGLQTSL